MYEVCDGASLGGIRSGHDMLDEAEVPAEVVADVVAEGASVHGSGNQTAVACCQVSLSQHGLHGVQCRSFCWYG